MKLKKFIYKNLKSIIIAIFVVALFILSSWVSHQYSDVLASSAFSDNAWGELAYFIISIVSVVIAGISASPLIPLALVIWGPVLTIILTALGWSIGSVIAFTISRRYGEKLVCRLVNVCDFEDYKNNINPKGLFWQLMLARIFLPVDVLSYAIGLFTKMSIWQFFVATLIGSTLFTWLAIYASDLPVATQMIFGILILIVFFVWAQKIIKSAFLKRTKKYYK